MAKPTDASVVAPTDAATAGLVKPVTVVAVAMNVSNLGVASVSTLTIQAARPRQHL